MESSNNTERVTVINGQEVNMTLQSNYQDAAYSEKQLIALRDVSAKLQSQVDNSGQNKQDLNRIQGILLQIQLVYNNILSHMTQMQTRIDLIRNEISKYTDMRGQVTYDYDRIFKDRIDDLKVVQKKYEDEVQKFQNYIDQISGLDIDTQVQIQGLQQLYNNYQSLTQINQRIKDLEEDYKKLISEEKESNTLVETLDHKLRCIQNELDVNQSLYTQLNESLLFIQNKTSQIKMSQINDMDTTTTNFASNYEKFMKQKEDLSQKNDQQIKELMDMQAELRKDFLRFCIKNDKQAPVQQHHYVFVLDVSTSMKQQVYFQAINQMQTKIQRLLSCLKAFIEQKKDGVDYISIYAFGNGTYHILEFKPIREVSFQKIETDIEQIVEKKEGTYCAEALEKIVKLVSTQRNIHTYCFMLTDGFFKDKDQILKQAMAFQELRKFHAKELNFITLGIGGTCEGPFLRQFTNICNSNLQNISIGGELIFNTVIIDQQYQEDWLLILQQLSKITDDKSRRIKHGIEEVQRQITLLRMEQKDYLTTMNVDSQINIDFIESVSKQKVESINQSKQRQIEALENQKTYIKEQLVQLKQSIDAKSLEIIQLRNSKPRDVREQHVLDINNCLEEIKSKKEEKKKLQAEIDQQEQEFSQQNIIKTNPQAQQIMLNSFSQHLKDLISRLNNAKNFLDNNLQDSQLIERQIKSLSQKINQFDHSAILQTLISIFESAFPDLHELIRTESHFDNKENVILIAQKMMNIHDDKLNLLRTALQNLSFKDIVEDYQGDNKKFVESIKENIEVSFRKSIEEAKSVQENLQRDLKQVESQIEIQQDAVKVLEKQKQKVKEAMGNKGAGDPKRVQEEIDHLEAQRQKVWAKIKTDMDIMDQEGSLDKENQRLIKKIDKLRNSITSQDENQRKYEKLKTQIKQIKEKIKVKKEIAEKLDEDIYIKSKEISRNEKLTASNIQDVILLVQQFRQGVLNKMRTFNHEQLVSGMQGIEEFIQQRIYAPIGMLTYERQQANQNPSYGIPKGLLSICQ